MVTHHEVVLLWPDVLWLMVSVKYNEGSNYEGVRVLSHCLLGVHSCCSTTDVFLCRILKCLLTHASCTHIACIYSQVFLKDRKLVRGRFVLAWCANAKHPTSGCRLESLMVWECLKVLPAWWAFDCLCEGFHDFCLQPTTQKLLAWIPPLLCWLEVPGQNGQGDKIVAGEVKSWLRWLYWEFCHRWQWAKASIQK